MILKKIIILFFITISILACNENLVLSEKDVIKYEYLKPFIVTKHTELEGSHNIDSEDFQFSYRTKNKIFALAEINEKAKKQGWRRYDLGKGNSSYCKKIEIFKSRLTLVKVNIHVVKNDDRIYCRVN